MSDTTGWIRGGGEVPPAVGTYVIVNLSDSFSKPTVLADHGDGNFSLAMTDQVILVGTPDQIRARAAQLNGVASYLEHRHEAEMETPGRRL